MSRERDFAVGMNLARMGDKQRDAEKAELEALRDRCKMLKAGMDLAREQRDALLAALEEAVELFGRNETDPDSWEVPARAAIAKAKVGGAS
jgi:vacuolar-type H+-ATPase subunit D/Vma8